MLSRANPRVERFRCEGKHAGDAYDRVGLAAIFYGGSALTATHLELHAVPPPAHSVRASEERSSRRRPQYWSDALSVAVRPVARLPRFYAKLYLPVRCRGRARSRKARERADRGERSPALGDSRGCPY